jgi:hypothetical protein
MPGSIFGGERVPNKPQRPPPSRIEGTTIVARAFSPPLQRELQDVFGRGQTRAHYRCFRCSRVRSTAWTNCNNVLTDTTPTEKWLVTSGTSGLHKLSADCKMPGSGPFRLIVAALPH